MANTNWLTEFPELERPSLVAMRKFLDGAYRDFSRTYGDAIEQAFDPLLYFLVWFEKLLLAAPWPMVLLFLVGLTHIAARSFKLTAGVTVSFLLIGHFGMWDNTMRTLSIITVATLLSIAIGIPIDTSHRLAPPALRRLGRATAESDVFYPNRWWRLVSCGEPHPGLNLHPPGIIKFRLAPLDSESIIRGNGKSASVAADDVINLGRPLRKSIRYARSLRRIFRFVSMNHLHAVRSHQAKKLTRLIKAEA